jgi:hypothetical protein
MQETHSYDDPAVVPSLIRAKYVWLETSYAATVLRATSPAEFSDLMRVLDDFVLTPDTWLVPGGNKGDIAQMLDDRFRALGWRETRIDTEVRGIFATNFISKGGKLVAQESSTVSSVYSEGYKVDNHKGRMIVDIEWNAKDGNLDRDLGAYRSWFEYGLINGAVIITKDRIPLLNLARKIWREYQRSLAVATPVTTLPVDLHSSTTTSFDKAEIRVKRQAAGTCPVLIIGVTAATWDGTSYSGTAAKTPTITPSQPASGSDEL